jgi:large subunit ribosomal protein L24e
MEQRVCSFCGNPLEPGTGMMFIKKDGSVYYFDKRRCKLSLLDFGRLNRRTKWTRHYPRGGAAAAEETMRAQQVAAEIAKAEAAGKEGAKKTPAKTKR